MSSPHHPSHPSSDPFPFPPQSAYQSQSLNHRPRSLQSSAAASPIASSSTHTPAGSNVTAPYPHPLPPSHHHPATQAAQLTAPLNYQSFHNHHNHPHHHHAHPYSNSFSQSYDHFHNAHPNHTNNNNNRQVARVPRRIWRRVLETQPRPYEGQKKSKVVDQERLWAQSEVRDGEGFERRCYRLKDWERRDEELGTKFTFKHIDQHHPRVFHPTARTQHYRIDQNDDSLGFSKRRNIFFDKLVCTLGEIDRYMVHTKHSPEQKLLCFVRKSGMDSTVWAKNYQQVAKEVNTPQKKYVAGFIHGGPLWRWDEEKEEWANTGMHALLTNYYEDLHSAAIHSYKNFDRSKKHRKAVLECARWMDEGIEVLERLKEKGILHRCISLKSLAVSVDVKHSNPTGRIVLLPTDSIIHLDPKDGFDSNSHRNLPLTNSGNPTLNRYRDTGRNLEARGDKSYVTQDGIVLHARSFGKSVREVTRYPEQEILKGRWDGFEEEFGGLMEKMTVDVYTHREDWAHFGGAMFQAIQICISGSATSLSERDGSGDWIANRPNAIKRLEKLVHAGCTMEEWITEVKAIRGEAEVKMKKHMEWLQRTVPESRRLWPVLELLLDTQSIADETFSNETLIRKIKAANKTLQNTYPYPAKALPTHPQRPKAAILAQKQLVHEGKLHMNSYIRKEIKKGKDLKEVERPEKISKKKWKTLFWEARIVLWAEEDEENEKAGGAAAAAGPVDDDEESGEDFDEGGSEEAGSDGEGSDQVEDDGSDAGNNDNDGESLCWETSDAENEQDRIPATPPSGPAHTESDNDNDEEEDSGQVGQKRKGGHSSGERSSSGRKKSRNNDDSGRSRTQEEEGEAGGVGDVSLEWELSDRE